MKVKKIAVTVSRTVQITQFHPSTVAVTMEADLGPDDNSRECREQLYKAASTSVVSFMNKEIEKWSE